MEVGKMTELAVFLILLLCGGIVRSGSNIRYERSSSNTTCDFMPKCSNSRYRSFNGSCNNLKRPNWGAANTTYVRLTKAKYADGIRKLPVSVTGCPLPEPRVISYRIFNDELILDHDYNLNAAQWGQIITHDMSFTGFVSQISNDQSVTCNSCEVNNVTQQFCAPITFPPYDPIHSIDGRPCQFLKRTETSMDIGCSAPNVPVDQITSVTAFMDLSLVYGNSDDQIAQLRTGTQGQMTTITREKQKWPPQVPDPAAICTQPPNNPCYLTGDLRSNQNIILTALQVILLREHNRIAEKLSKINPHWNDEKLFQEARRINIAQIQHVNYYEFLPILLGRKHMVQNKLIYHDPAGYVNDYDSNTNPSIINEHATAAYRHFHTLLRGDVRMISENREISETVRLSDWFDNPLLLEKDSVFDRFIRGCTTQKMRLSDQHWTSELTNNLFKLRYNTTFGDDLRATDIQRGRDHGLGSYISARAACDLPVPKTFNDMRRDISEKNVIVLQQLYASPEDVDLVVGGSLERNVPEAMVGPTFLKILTKQFYRTRVGDRYFYENGADPDIAFTYGQLKAIRQGANVARLLCDNTDGINQMQRKAFRRISADNPLVPCHKLPSINLEPWRDRQ